MIPGMIPMGRGVEGPPAVSYLAQTTDTADLTTYTFAGQSLGTASEDRRIVVGVLAVQVASRSISSVTVGGIAASLVVGNVTAAQDLHGLYVADVPSGTTGDIVVTLDGASSRCAIATWAVTGIGSTTAAATGSGTTTANLNVLDKDVVIVLAYKSTTATIAPTGYTERFDASIEAAFRFEGGDHTATATETPRTISAATPNNLYSAAWR